MVQFTKRMEYMKSMADVVKNLFSTGNAPGLIPFSIGSPASELLSVDIVWDIASDILTWDKRGVEALQYSSPKGIADLREIVAHDLLDPKGIPASPDDIAIVCGGWKRWISFANYSSILVMSSSSKTRLLSIA